MKGSFSHTFSPTFINFIPDDTHSDWSEMKCQSNFNLFFPIEAKHAILRCSCSFVGSVDSFSFVIPSSIMFSYIVNIKKTTNLSPKGIKDPLFLRQILVNVAQGHRFGELELPVP